MLREGVEEGNQKGLPDGMSCAGIFGSDSTKTVVMEHHRMNGSRSSPSHQYASRPVTKAIEISSAIRTKSGQADPKNQKS